MNRSLNVQVEDDMNAIIVDEILSRDESSLSRYERQLTYQGTRQNGNQEEMFEKNEDLIPEFTSSRINTVNNRSRVTSLNPTKKFST